jgi:hypothetical protein
LSGWGWQDNAYPSGASAGPIYFATTGRQTIRIQTREDGLTVDQIVLSPQRFLSTSPGSTKDDATILPIDGQPPAATLVRGPYLQQAASDSLRIVWATRENGQGQVRYAPQPGGGELLAVAGSRFVSASATGLTYDYYQHEAALQALTPSTTYRYQLDLDATPLGGAATAFSFRTAPADGTGTVRFIAFGDSGTGSTDQRRLAEIMAADSFDFALHAGDIAYGGSSGTGDASWATYHSWFFGVYAPWLPSRAFFPAEGNHDSRLSNGHGRAYLDLFSLPRNGGSASFPDHVERYYSFDYGPVHFVALDTEFAFQEVARRAEQIAWLEADLAATSQPWKVAVYHRSPFSAGGEHGSDLVVRNAFAPVFERYGVQLSISAHEHTYERSRPTAIAGGLPVVYVVSGGGGAPLYPRGTASWTAYSASRHHYVRTEADGCRLSVEAVGADAAVFDRTTLTRCSTPATPDIVMYAADATDRAGQWTLTADSSAAAGVKMREPDRSAAKLASASANPASYFDLTFDAVAGVAYRLWIRGRADANSWANDSAFVQFSGAIDAGGNPVYRIGTSSATTYVLEECSGCGVAAWGWQDNGYGTAGPLIAFAESGAQRLRIQSREDGLSIDQIVLSPERYLSAAPGAAKHDAVILSK